MWVGGVAFFLLCFELFERQEKEVVVVKSWTFQSFIFLEELSYLFSLFNQAEFGLADNCRDLSLVGVDARGLCRQPYDDSVIIVREDSDRLPRLVLRIL